tara:strand:- start:355 stop:681 length:327 start_codon:yes stop_codon:yes gene_type:complete
MEKFLTVTNTAGRKDIIPITNLVAIQSSTSSVIDLFCHNFGTLDVIEITLDSADPLYVDNFSFAKGSMVDVLQNMIIEASARGSYTDPYFDITNRIPIKIEKVLPSVA